MNCNVEITAVGTADGLEVSIHGGSVGMMTAAELIVARVLMAVADDEENLAGLKDSMFEIINEMVKDCWAEKTAKTEAEKEAAVNLRPLWRRPCGKCFWICSKSTRRFSTDRQDTRRAGQNF